MSGLIIAAVIFVTLIFVLYGLIVRSTAKENRRDTLKLADAWANYYEETQKFKPIKKFTITYVNGNVDVIEGRSFTDRDDQFTINDEHGKIILAVMKSRLIAIRTDRHTYYEKGPRFKEGDA